MKALDVWNRLSEYWDQQLASATDPIADANWQAGHKRKGFFTDTSICIGCKACEVACKEWNRVPARGPEDHGLEFSGDSYDNSNHLGANTWRHVAFIEQTPEQQIAAKRSGAVLLGMPTMPGQPASAAGDATTMNVPAEAPGCGASCGCGSIQTPLDQLGDRGAIPADPATVTELDQLGDRGAIPADPATMAEPVEASATQEPQGIQAVRWLMSSDVCKHCTHAGCLDVCPTGALFRSEFGTVVVQSDVCNGCGYCVASCPFGVIGKREGGTVEVGDGTRQPVLNGGIAQKCTLCYDRLTDGLTPACAQTCPTTSIKFGDHDEMVTLARERLKVLHAQGHTEARLYGANPDDGVGGTGSVFLLMDEPEAYGLPPDPVVTTADLPRMFTMAGVAGTAMIGVALSVFVGNGRFQ